MNAKTAHSQLIGGIVFGLGMALFEETHVDGETGRIVNANVADYLLPVNADVPDILPSWWRMTNARPMCWVRKELANCLWSALRPPWRMRCTTPRVSVCANCRYG